MWLHYNKTYLSNTDSSSRVMTHRLLQSHEGWELAQTLFDYRAEAAVRHVLSNRDHSQFLVSTLSSAICLVHHIKGVQDPGFYCK